MNSSGHNAPFLPTQRNEFARGSDPTGVASLAQRIARELTETGIDWETIGGDWQVSLNELYRRTPQELAADAAACGVANVDRLTRDEQLLGILRSRIAAGGILTGSGTLQILPDGFGFLRSATCHYLAGPDDIYVSPSQVRRFHLRTGAVLSGQIRPPKSNERFFALLRIHTINGMPPDEYQRVTDFETLTPSPPGRRIELEHDPTEAVSRLLNMFAPIGFGQRGLIVGPPRAGKTTLLQAVARAVLANYLDTFVFFLMIDERPEEVTALRGELNHPQCEVISSTFDELPARHIQASEMVLEKAKRMVEIGRDVVILLDSFTQLALAWLHDRNPSGDESSGSFDAADLQRSKAFLSSARSLEGGASLTILATATVAAGSRLGDLIYEQVQGSVNQEIVLDAALAEQRVWPAIHLSRSGTRREEQLVPPAEYRQISLLRRRLAAFPPPAAMEQLVGLLGEYPTNAELLASLT
jgi:transcription termination factor Rho